MNISTDLKRGRATGTRWMYQYTYANPTDCGPRQPLQLEVWTPKGRKGGRWNPATVRLSHHKTWRTVRPHHSHADKLSHSIASVKSCGYARSVADQIALYMAWVESKGLTRVTRFSDCKYVPPKSGRLAVVSVDPAEFIGPAPQPEPCEAAP